MRSAHRLAGSPSKVQASQARSRRPAACQRVRAHSGLLQAAVSEKRGAKAQRRPSYWLQPCTSCARENEVTAVCQPTVHGRSPMHGHECAHLALQVSCKRPKEP